MADMFYLTEDDLRYQREVNARVMTETHHTEKPGTIAGGGSPAWGVWSPVIVKDYHDGPVSAPWAVLFGEVRIVYRGMMHYTVYPLLLPASIASLSAVYLYAVDTGELVLRWSATKVTPEDADPIRYIGKLTPETMTFSELPAGVVALPGGPVDIIRNIAEESAYTSDLIAALTPQLTARLYLLTVKIPAGSPNLDEIDAMLDLSDYSELDEFLLVYTGGDTIEAVEDLDSVGNVDPIRPLAKIGAPTTLGFRSIEYQNPLYSDMMTSRQYELNDNAIEIRQDYTKPDRSIATATMTVDLEETPSNVYLEFYADYLAGSDTLVPNYAYLRRSDDPPESPAEGITRFHYRIGKVTPREFGVAKVDLYYPLISPEYGVSRANWVYNWIYMQLNDTYDGIYAQLNSLDSRVTALEGQ